MDDNITYKTRFCNWMENRNQGKLIGLFCPQHKNTISFYTYQIKRKKDSGTKK